MPYRVSPQPVDERRAELDAILHKGSVSFRSNNAAALAYRIREAINAAWQLDIEPYNKLWVKIAVSGDLVNITPKRQWITSEPVEAVSAAKVSRAVSEFEVVKELMDSKEAEHHFPHFFGDIEAVAEFGREYGWLIESEPFLIARRA